jgi:predicted alpha/beta superfamily hydrolase
MKILATALALFMSGTLLAQTQKETLESYYLQEERSIRICLPEDYDEAKTYPLILVLDAEYLFDMVVANARFYHRNDRMPNSIIVGIDHEEEYLRERDFSFDPNNGYLTQDSDAFYSFLEKEVLPYCKKNYSIAPFKMFIGYDSSAALGNFFLYGDRSLFTAYLSISPVLPNEMENLIPSRLLDHSQQIFYNLVLEKGPTTDRQRILQMNQSIASIQREGLHYYFDQYEAPDHTTIVAYGISKAFDNVFKLLRPITPMEYKKEILTSNDPAIQYLYHKYEMIEELLGFKKPYELNDIMAIYAASEKKDDFESLKDLADICKRQWPETMMGDYLQGEYFENMGEVKKALRAFEKAYQKNEIDFLTKEAAYDKIAAIKDDFGY